MSPVLIVEDDAALRELLALILQGEGMVADTAANGLEALERIDARPPGVILLDMTMPVMDGWQFCRELDLRSGPRPRIVVVTAATDPARRADEVHADGWLAKPFDRDALLTLVRRFASSPTTNTPA
jgi:CheY-like chemotaxis protein